MKHTPNCKPSFLKMAGRVLWQCAPLVSAFILGVTANDMMAHLYGAWTISAMIVMLPWVLAWLLLLLSLSHND